MAKTVRVFLNDRPSETINGVVGTDVGERCFFVWCGTGVKRVEYMFPLSAINYAITTNDE